MIMTDSTGHIIDRTISKSRHILEIQLGLLLLKYEKLEACKLIV